MALTLCNNSSKYAFCWACVLYCGPGSTRHAAAFSGRKPGSTSSTRRKLRINSPAPTSSTHAKAISETTSAARAHICRLPPLAPRWPSDALSETAVVCNAGAMPSTKPVALNQTNFTGTNLSVWESTLPGISRNADGTLRSATGWPKGALSSDQGNGLVLWLSFTGWNGISNVPDASPSLNDMTLPYSTLNTPSTNYLLATNGPNGLGAAWSTAYRYGIVTNWNGLTSLTNGTVATWGRY